MKVEAIPSPDGYQRTELGLIPDDWELKSVGDLFREGIIEKPMDGNHGAIHPKSVDFVDSGIPFVMANDVQNGRVDFQRCSFIRKEQADSLMKGFAKQGDVLLTHKATMGNTAIVGKIEWEYIMLTPQVTYYRVVNPQRLSNRYLRYFFDSSAFQHRLEVLSGGGTRSYLGIVGQQALSIALPPTLAEQEAIAKALGESDALVESLEALLVKKRCIKQGAMQELLTGKKRLPGFNGKWETVRAGDIGRFRGGSGFPTKFQGGQSGDYPFYKVSDMNNEGNDTFMQSANHYITEATRKIIGAVLFPEHCVVFAKVGAAVFLERKKILSRPSCLDNNMAAFVLDRGRADFRFVHFLMLNMRLGDLVSTTALPALSGSTLSEIELNLPDLNEQAAIAETLSDMDAEITAIETKLSKARQIKQGMMHDLLTGRIRLV